MKIGDTVRVCLHERAFIESKGLVKIDYSGEYLGREGTEGVLHERLCIKLDLSTCSESEYVFPEWHKEQNEKMGMCFWETDIIHGDN